MSMLTIFILSTWISSSGGEWLPAKELLIESEPELKALITDKALKSNVVLPDWSSYKFYFSGESDTNGRFVYITATCRDPQGNRIRRVDDGAPCFFTIKYNPVTKKYFSLAFNTGG